MSARRRNVLKPLLEGKIRSAFVMTEPRRCLVGCHEHRDPHRARRRRIRDQRPQVVVVRCRRSALRGRRSSWARPTPTRPRHTAAVHDHRARRHARRAASMRPLPVFGYDDAPHGHCRSHSRRMSACRPKTCCSAKAAASRSAQGRLGPGRIHHCMRTDRRRPSAPSKNMCERLLSRERFRQADRRSVRVGTSAWPKPAPKSRCARLLTLQSGLHDGHGGQQGRPHRDRNDQGRGAEYGAARLSIDAIQVAWRRAACPPISAAARIWRASAHAASRRRSGRGAQSHHRAARVQEAHEQGARRGGMIVKKNRFIRRLRAFGQAG